VHIYIYAYARHKIYAYIYIDLENRQYGRGDPSRWPPGTLYRQELALTSPTSDGISVGIVSSRTQATEFSLLTYHHVMWRYRVSGSESSVTWAHVTSTCVQLSFQSVAFFYKQAIQHFEICTWNELSVVHCTAILFWVSHCPGTSSLSASASRDTAQHWPAFSSPDSSQRESMASLVIQVTQLIWTLNMAAGGRNCCHNCVWRHIVFRIRGRYSEGYDVVGCDAVQFGRSPTACMDSIFQV
jgi:hypothetical protein